MIKTGTRSGSGGEKKSRNDRVSTSPGGLIIFYLFAHTIKIPEIRKRTIRALFFDASDR
jgi:hypothetical protein